MSVTIQVCFESAVIRASKDTFVGSYIGKDKTIIESDMRKRDWQEVLKTDAEIYWCGKTYPADVHEFPTFHCPFIYRFVIERGYYLADDGRREYFTPEPSEVPTRHHMSRNIIRPACFLAVICGVTLRNMAAIFTVLFQVPVTKSGISRWINGIGCQLSGEDILGKLTEQRKPEECHIDAYYPPGTDRCVMVIRDDDDRILITHETDSENAQDAKMFLKKLKDSGMNIAFAFSDYNTRCATFYKCLFELYIILIYISLLIKYQTYEKSEIGY